MNRAKVRRSKARRTMMLSYVVTFDHQTKPFHYGPTRIKTCLPLILRLAPQDRFYTDTTDLNAVLIDSL